MPADRPAPSALDALARAARDAADREDPILALLKDVDASTSKAYGPTADKATVDAVDWLAFAAPRLAAIVRVLVEAVNQAASWGEGATVGPEFDCPYHAMEARSALARAEAIAKGDA